MQLGFIKRETFGNRRSGGDFIGKFFQARRNIVPVIKRCLQCRRNRTGIDIFAKVFGHQNKLAVTGAVFKGCEFHRFYASGIPVVKSCDVLFID